MAKYQVGFSCGHTETIELFGKVSERERKIKWFEDCGECSECYKKRMHEVKEKEKEEFKSKNNGLAELQGTEKQISWADKIRTEVIKTINELEDRYIRMKDKVKPGQEEKYETLVNAVSTVKDKWIKEISAQWIIENRTQDIQAEVKKLLS